MARKRSSGGRSRRKANVLSVDFSNVEEKIFVEPGEYAVKVAEVETAEGQAGDYLKWTFEIMDEGDFEGAKLYYNTSLTPQSLWNLKSLLDAAGFDIPKETVDIDMEELPGCELMVSVEEGEYDGKPQSRVVDFWAIGEAEAEGEEEPEPKSRGRGKAKAGTKSSKATSKKAAGKKAAGKEKEEEEEPLPTEEDVSDMSEDELEDLNKEFDLKVKLSKYRTLTKKRGAIIDKLEESGNLGE